MGKFVRDRCQALALAMFAIVLALALACDAQAQQPIKQGAQFPAEPPEVLCERVQFRTNISFGGQNAMLHAERPAEAAKKVMGRHGLSSITVPADGWTLQAMSIYIRLSKPEDAAKLHKARFNVVPRRADLPGADFDPRQGKTVEVRASPTQKDNYELRASGLDSPLAPGEYWIGLTPLSADVSVSHLIAHDVRDARFDDVYQQTGEGPAVAKAGWLALRPEQPGQYWSIRLEGWRNQPGQVRDWTPVEGKKGRQLFLRFKTFDPLAGEPEIPDKFKAAKDCSLWIVQFGRIADREAREQLVKDGAALLGYLPEDAYVVRLKANQADVVRKLPGVRWVGPYHPAYRVDPNVFPEPKNRNFSILPMRAHAAEPEGWRNVFVHAFDRDPDGKKIIADRLSEVGGKVLFQSPRGDYIAARVPLDQVATLARCDAVCAIERRYGAFELKRTTGANSAGMEHAAQGEKRFVSLAQIRALGGADVVKQAGGYEGLGVRVGFWDLGVRPDHVDLLARPLTLIGPPYFMTAAHGTEIASILCGEGRGDPRARGLLPLGGLIFAIDQAEWLHEDRHGLVERFVNDHGAVVISSSSSNWGGDENIDYYDGYSRLLDDLVLRHDVLICTAIGNGQPKTPGQTGSWAKNVVVVGGVHPRGSVKREDHRPIFTGGPAPDGRVKPDLVHFAADVFCAAATSPKAYAIFGGTSCATPLVAGHCGLMMEMWADGALGKLPLGRTVFQRRPHASTARALMINSAFRYPTDDPKTPFTRVRQGWGMPDLGRLLESKGKLFVVDEDFALGDRRCIEYGLDVKEDEPELRATLVYTDPVGPISAAKALVNDLDLIVISPDGERFHGNHALLDANYSKAGGAPDRLNNVENVFIRGPKAGKWRVIVAAHRVACNYRETGARQGQPFALVVAGVDGRQGGRV